MSTKGFKRLLFGEKMPDKDDPKYKERYEKEVETGRKFARWCRLDGLPPIYRDLPVTTEISFSYWSLALLPLALLTTSIG